MKTQNISEVSVGLKVVLSSSKTAPIYEVIGASGTNVTVQNLETKKFEFVDISDVLVPAWWQKYNFTLRAPDFKESV